jgi:hypothetical protein
MFTEIQLFESTDIKAWLFGNKEMEITYVLVEI